MPVQSKMTGALAGAAAGAIALTSQSPSSFVAPSSVSSQGHSSLSGAADVDRPASTSSAAFSSSSIATASAAAGAIAALAGMSRMKPRGRVSKGEEARIARMAKKVSARDNVLAGSSATSNKPRSMWPVAAAAAVAEVLATETAADVEEGAPSEPVAPPPFDPAAQIGAVEPLGFFDPLGFTQVGDEKGFNKLRAAEIKHGRVAMMASIGAIGQPFLRLPMFDFPNATGTFGALANGRVTFGLFVLFVASGIMELVWREEEGREPGNFGDPFGVDMYTEEMRNKEISNGRMAMLSVFGIFAAEVATGKNAIEQLTLFADASETQ